MPKCALPGCKNGGVHLFPKDVTLRRKWVKAMRRKKPVTDTLRLCREHFLESDYVGESAYTGRQQVSRHLKKGVVPSIFPWTKKSAAPTSGTDKHEQAACTLPKEPILKKVATAAEHEPQKQENPTEKPKLLRDRSVRLKNRKAYLANRRCSVPQCNTRPSKEVSLHLCPNNAAVRSEWAEALKIGSQNNKNMVACTIHFSNTDFIQTRNAEHRVLKPNAVPSRNLPNRNGLVSVKHKPTKKLASSKAFEGQKTMTKTVDERTEVLQEEEIRECRACLKKLDDKKSCCNVFQAWVPPWSGMEATIAEDLAKLANVELSITDRHSKVICSPCYQRLLDAAAFAANVRSCDLILRQRYTADIDMEKVWPKPIQVDKNINGSVYNNTMDVEIKQEIVSDEEYTANETDNAYMGTELANLDIKIEPQEIEEAPPMNITINGTISLDPLNSENKQLTNGTEEYYDEQFLEPKVKQEPMSDEEHEIEQGPDLPLECLLCTKSFNSVTGLKAHVIAQHSYNGVKRKRDGSLSPDRKRREKHQCAICRRSFQTSTDLMVHETCHNKHACYGCTEKFDSFELLTRHRKRCKASIDKTIQKLKTLEDVTRPLLVERVEDIEKENTIRKEIKEEKDSDIKESDSDMKVKSEKVQEESEMNEVKSENVQEEISKKVKSEIEEDREYKI